MSLELNNKVAFKPSWREIKEKYFAKYRKGALDDDGGGDSDDNNGPRPPPKSPRKTAPKSASPPTRKSPRLSAA